MNDVVMNERERDSVSYRENGDQLWSKKIIFYHCFMSIFRGLRRSASFSRVMKTRRRFTKIIFILRMIMFLTEGTVTDLVLSSRKKWESNKTSFGQSCSWWVQSRNESDFSLKRFDFFILPLSLFEMLCLRNYYFKYHSWTLIFPYFDSNCPSERLSLKVVRKLSFLHQARVPHQHLPFSTWDFS
jgi:hypothetical protein